MDVVSSASGVFATVTIAFQLGQGVRKLLEFWSNVQRAPDRVAAIFDDLSLLSSVLVRVETNSHLDPITTKALLNCRSKIQTLEQRIYRSGRHLVSSNGWKKKWSELNITLKDKEINELREAITNAHRLLMGLQLATIEQYTRDILDTIQTTEHSACWRPLPEYKNDLGFHLARKDVAEIRTDPDVVHMGNFLVQRSSIRPHTRLGDRGDKRYVFHLPHSLRKLGFSYGIDLRIRSTVGWQTSLNVFRAVPESAPIFQYCRDGDISAVRCLLKNGYASPWDRDPLGRTPLFVAAESLQLEVAELLIHEGADTTGGETQSVPISSIRKSQGHEVKPKIAMIRLLQRHCGEGYDESVMVGVMIFMLFRYRAYKDIPMSLNERWQAAEQIILQLLPEWDEHDSVRTSFLGYAIYWHFDHSVLQSFLRLIPGSLSEIEEFSPIHGLIYRRLMERDPVSAKLIVQKTTNLHRCLKIHSRLEPQTPTTLALLESSLFFAWRKLLQDMKFDIHQFIDDELEQSIVRSRGWTTATLRLVFELDFVPHIGSRDAGYPKCERCGRGEVSYGSGTPVDLEWRRLLRAIRCRHAATHEEEQLTGEVHPANLRVPNSSPAHDSMSFPGLTPRDWPYRIVCNAECQDYICVSQLYENDDTNEPVLPYYAGPIPYQARSKVDTAHSKVRNDPTSNMPGAYPQ